MLVVIGVASGQDPGDAAVVDAGLRTDGVGFHQLTVRGTNDVAHREKVETAHCVAAKQCREAQQGQKRGGSFSAHGCQLGIHRWSPSTPMQLSCK
jgi:hypothetical protein